MSVVFLEGKMSIKAKHPIRATEKTLRIIEALQELGEAGVTELANELGFAKGTVHHHLSTLQEYKYVVNEGTTYRLGMRFFEIGEFTRRQREIYEVARSEINELAADTGEVANLMVEEHGQGIYIYIARGEHAVKLDTVVGTCRYLHTSALGKAILAYLPDERFEEIIDQHGLPAETPQTVTDYEVLIDKLEQIRERGVAFDGEERAEGIRCVAAPVTDKEGELIGAVSVSGPVTRLKEERFKETLPEKVQDTATVIGINTSYS
jgi:DNA-binding IclR family transcriptional regulator